jgi:hypothetical protein
MDKVQQLSKPIFGMCVANVGQAFRVTTYSIDAQRTPPVVFTVEVYPAGRN